MSTPSCHSLSPFLMRCCCWPGGVPAATAAGQWPQASPALSRHPPFDCPILPLLLLGSCTCVHPAA
jgi:hypothetical protein